MIDKRAEFIAFSRQCLTKIPSVFMERQNQHFGVCRYRVGEEWVGVKISGESGIFRSTIKEGIPT